MSNKTDIWMPFYVGEYLADTMHLTTEQHGAYCLMLFACWKQQGRIEGDDGALASITGLPMPRWLKHKPRLLRFFQAEGEFLVHKRVLIEHTKAAAISKSKSANGTKGAVKRWHANGESNGEGDGKPMANAMANASRIDTPSQSPLPKPEKPKAAAADTSLSPPPSTAEAAPEAITHRAIEIAVLLRKTGASLTATNPTVREWASSGATDAQLLTACETAQQRRHDRGDASPVNAGFINTILGDVRSSASPSIDYTRLVRELEAR